MIITRTPYRISFFGGGTDFPDWYREHGGAVLATSINRYCYISCRYLPPFFEHTHRIVYSIIEDVRDLDEIRHPAVRESLRFLRLTDGLEIHHDGDLPKQTGLGTSSSFTVGLLNALHALRGDPATPEQLAREAIEVERNRCREHVGDQDQITAAFGGFNLIRFGPGDRHLLLPVELTPERAGELQASLLLFFTGFSRLSTEIAAEHVRNIPARRQELAALAQLADEGVRLLSGGAPLAEFGRLLDENWRLKRRLNSRVSNPVLDDLYERARRAGALGGKLTGAGGGGFLLLFVEPDRRTAVRRALADLLHVPFAFDRTGSRVIVNQPSELETRESVP